MGKDLTYNCFCHFIEGLRIIVSDSDYQREIMGARTVGCGWELKSDILNDCDYLTGNCSSYLTRQEVHDIKSVRNRVSEIDSEDIVGKDAHQWLAIKQPIRRFIRMHKHKFEEVSLYFQSNFDWLEQID